jgi:hypothetical protein
MDWNWKDKAEHWLESNRSSQKKKQQNGKSQPTVSKLPKASHSPWMITGLDSASAGMQGEMHAQTLGHSP